MKTVHTENAPAAIGPYSQAVAVGNLLFCSGQIGLNPKTGQLVDGIEKQTEQVLQNLAAVLQAGGSRLEQVVKTTIYLKNMEDFSVVNETYGKYFKKHNPARATVAVASLPKNALVEIDAIAVI